MGVALVRKFVKFPIAADIAPEPKAPPKIEPISVRIPAAVAATGLSRSRIYELIKAGELEIAKDGSSTLIFFSSLRAAIERRRL